MEEFDKIKWWICPVCNDNFYPKDKQKHITLEIEELKKTLRYLEDIK